MAGLFYLNILVRKWRKPPKSPPPFCWYPTFRQLQGCKFECVDIGTIGVEWPAMPFGKINIVWLPFFGDCFKEFLISVKVADSIGWAVTGDMNAQWRSPSPPPEPEAVG